MIRKILIFLLIALIVIQFIHPARNKSTGPHPYALETKFPVPEKVRVILAKACNDCHTNNTDYPWYSRVQPAHWWLDNHIREGKEHLNLDEYTHRNLRYQYHKMEEIAEQLNEGEMPLKSYTWLHKDAILTEAEKNELISWADGIRAGMEAKYPRDSLIRKQ
jgi:hypothetical protein